MGLLSRFWREPNEPTNTGVVQDQSSNIDVEFNKHEDGPLHIFNWRVIYMGVLVSMGGFIFGYDTGQISGFLEMEDFLRRFSDTTKDGAPAFSNGRSGTIVGLLSIGTLIGALIAAPVSDKFGRKWSIVFWNLIFCVGVIVQIVTESKWYQIALGRWVAGLGVGGLSVLTPMYQSETAPRQVRGALVSAYQLFITLGIFTAYCINYGTETDQSGASWRIPMGVGFIWPALMAFGMLFLPDSPRWQYRHGKTDIARATIAKSYGVPEYHPIVQNEIREIQEKLDAENAGGGKHPWYEIFTGPRMAYRTLLGIALQALQQLTGANFFFYYGTTIFTATGLSNSYVTSMILGAVNFVCTFPGLYFVDRFGRRPCLMAGALWMFMCFIVFASVGHFALDQETPENTPKAGSAMIVFACLFIAAFASTWGPMVWAVVGEIYPSRYRAKCMGLATASNWVWNFCISFFTPYITGAIDYRYGYVFAGCCFAAFVTVYFFVCESQGRSLEEIDTMYIYGVKAWKSKNWVPPEGEGLTTLDNTYLTPGARDIRKPGAERREAVEGENVEKKDVYHPQA
ncbi:hexose transporter hxt5 [Neofusicoccum ribis]|uniref:Hexose transporter hxt5 n=1 Tax=Neofusicoccum ribis TaxID=45134 RepID=A0ABR3STB8_9PEZI